MNPKQKTMAWLGGGVALVVVGTAVMFVLARGCTPTPAPKLVISKETTYLTGPLLANGGIDWVAALEAEARAEGLKDEENGAPLMKEALEGFVNLEEFVENLSPTASDEERKATNEALDRALEALAQGQIDAPHIELLLRWLDACAPAFEKARQATKRPGWFLIGKERALSEYVTLELLEGLDDLTRALGLRVAARAARGDVQGALADAEAACAAARATGTPATLEDQDCALAREIAVLQQLLRTASATPPLPADRIWAIASQRQARWRGEDALRESLRANRIIVTSALDRLRVSDPGKHGSDRKLWTRVLCALQLVDLNPLFRRLQQTFDQLEVLLLDGSRPEADRIGAARAWLDRLVRECRPLHVLELRPGALSSALMTNQQLAEIALANVLHDNCYLMYESLPEWLSLTAKRDALLAELAFLAGAPARRDSWLGEPLVVTRKEDGSLEVGGALIELARERGSELDEE